MKYDKDADAPAVRPHWSASSMIDSSFAVSCGTPGLKLRFNKWSVNEVTVWCAAYNYTNNRDMQSS